MLAYSYVMHWWAAGRQHVIQGACSNVLFLFHGIAAEDLGHQTAHRLRLVVGGGGRVHSGYVILWYVSALLEEALSAGA
jgi:hypothetical protein